MAILLNKERDCRAPLPVQAISDQSSKQFIISLRTPDRRALRAENAYQPLKGDCQMDIRSTLKELCAAFNAHDLDRIMNFFAEDCVLEMPKGDRPWGTRAEGKANVRRALATRFEGLPDVHYGFDEHFVDEAAQTGISKWTLTGTTREGISKEVRGCDFYTFHDGKVTRKDSYWKIVQ